MGYAAEYLIAVLPDDLLVICDVNSLTHRLHGGKRKFVASANSNVFFNSTEVDVQLVKRRQELAY